MVGHLGKHIIRAFKLDGDDGGGLTSRSEGVGDGDDDGDDGGAP